VVQSPGVSMVARPIVSRPGDRASKAVELISKVPGKELVHIAVSGAAGLATRTPVGLVWHAQEHLAEDYYLSPTANPIVSGFHDWVWEGTVSHLFESSESSSQSGPNVRGDQNGGSGGTLVFSSYGSLPPGTAVHKAGWNPDTSDFFKKRGKHHCKKGYTLAKVGGAMMCIKLPRKK